MNKKYSLENNGGSLWHQISKKQADYILSNINEDTDYIKMIVDNGIIFCTDIAEFPASLDEKDDCIHAIFIPNKEGYKTFFAETFLIYLTKKKIEIIFKGGR